MTAGEGERLEAARRQKFWRLLTALGIVGAISGFAIGVAGGYAHGRGEPLSGTMQLVMTCAILLCVAAAAYWSWRFFATVDEVEVADNLWGSLIGFYVYAFLFPTWWALNLLGIAPEPDDWVIFAAAMITAIAAYAYRKWSNR